MEVERNRDLYYETEFAKALLKMDLNPDYIDTKAKLLDFWQLALDERSRNRKYQDRIATDAARNTGVIEFDNIEGDPYQDIILQFMNMDHMHSGYSEEADAEWSKLAQMLADLKQIKES